ncbi:hypothetical protein LCGC14_2493240, partial [marine sediment metagenome]
DNPKGYFEFEPVKKTKDDSSWVQVAAGKAVKMVYTINVRHVFIPIIKNIKKNLKDIISNVHGTV